METAAIKENMASRHNAGICTCPNRENRYHHLINQSFSVYHPRRCRGEIKLWQIHLPSTIGGNVLGAVAFLPVFDIKA